MKDIYGGRVSGHLSSLWRCVSARISFSCRCVSTSSSSFNCLGSRHRSRNKSRNCSGHRHRRSSTSGLNQGSSRNRRYIWSTKSSCIGLKNCSRSCITRVNRSCSRESHIYRAESRGNTRGGQESLARSGDACGSTRRQTNSSCCQCASTACKSRGKF